MPRAFLIQPLRPEFELIRGAIASATASTGLELVRPDSLFGPEMITERIAREIAAADVVIADITGANQNVMYELGLAHGAGRPVVLITSDPTVIPFDLSSVRVIRYGPTAEAVAEFQMTLAAVLASALADPERFAPPPVTRRKPKTVFISYSHVDNGVMERLLVHLKPLERENVIDAWTDTRIHAGADWQDAIAEALEAAAAAILLVSADFLASDFIVDNELPPLLESAAQEGTLVVPVIIKPCRYVRDPALRRLQAINDPARPLAGLSEVEQEALLDSIAALVERALR